MNIPTICCNETMELITPNTTDGAHEKHVPVVEIMGRIVKITVGETVHPMVHDHYIEWITLSTNRTVHTLYLVPGEAPRAYFALQPDEEPLQAFAYCNLHGLWSSDI